jgi:hypothetical protein
VEGLRGEDVVYVSGRARPPGEMNGKSGNLNFCASQLYPKARPRLPACARRLAPQARACCTSWSARRSSVRQLVPCSSMRCSRCVKDPARLGR